MKRQTVVEVIGTPFLTTVEGKVGWLGELG